MENVTEVYDCSASDTVFVKSENASCDPPLWVASFQGGDVDKMENSGEEYDGGGLQKKRRLKPEQVQFLEKSFELENKLEPERKAQLAKEAGLQPRQVAIWFQNRRARYKTKLLEKDYTCLKASYEKLKADYVKLFQENEEMRNEIKSLTGKAGVGEKRETKEEKSDQISPLEKAAEEVTPAAASSDVVDSDSVHCGDSEEYSQEEEDETPCKVLLHHPFFPKLELESHDDLQPNCCNLGFPVQKQGTWFWHY